MTVLMASPAPIWKRIAAGLIDYVVMWLLVVSPLCIFIFGDVDTEIEFLRAGWGQWFSLLMIFGLWLFPFCLRDVVGGRGLGKWIVGIKVVNAADRRTTPSVVNLIARNATVWFSPVEMVFAYQNPDRIRYGDRLGGTMVVDDPLPAGASKWMHWGGRVAVLVLAVVGSSWCANRASIYFVQRSQIYRVAKDYLDGYKPLADVAPLGASLPAGPTARWAPTDNGAMAVVWVNGENSTTDVRTMVLMSRDKPKTSPWKVDDARGFVVLDTDKKDKQRGYVFWTKKSLSRFLTEDEFRKLNKEGLRAEEVLPELKLSTDNATTPASKPADNQTAK